MATKTSTDYQVEGLESRDHNIINGVRTIRSRCVLFGINILTQAKPSEQNRESLLFGPFIVL